MKYQQVDAAAIRQIMDAALFSARAHNDQYRDDLGDPYLVHLAEVAAMCASIKPLDPVLVAAAWLHDTLEYTETNVLNLRDLFGNAVTDLVQDVSDPPGLKGRARRERQVVHTSKASMQTKRLKLADRISNIEEILHAPRKRVRYKSAARYLKWSRRVVDVCRGASAKLEERFDKSAKLLQSRIDTFQYVRAES